jgi:hypothetical protein
MKSFLAEARRKQKQEAAVCDEMSHDKFQCFSKTSTPLISRAKGAFENSPQFQLRVCVFKMNPSQRDG